MTMRHSSSSKGPRNPTDVRAPILRLLLAGLLGVAAALLVSCGSSGKNLIPVGDAGPLQSDFESVRQAAENGNGSCAATEEALLKTDQDFGALPSTVDAGLRNTLRQGITNLRARALVLCAQPLAQTTTTSTAPTTTTSTPTITATPTVTQPTSTTTTPAPATTTTPTTSSPGGGTPAPGAGEASPGASSGQGGGTGAGESGSGGSGGSGSAGGGVGAGGQEGAK